MGLPIYSQPGTNDQWEAAHDWIGFVCHMEREFGAFYWTWVSEEALGRRLFVLCLVRHVGSRNRLKG